MVERQLRRRGIDDPRVLEAMRAVPREAYVGADMTGLAYEDTALPIAEEQTISQPYVVALMLQAAKPAPQDRLLEIGTGSGYAAAVAARLVARVVTVERHAALAETARRRLAAQGIDTVAVHTADGTRGWPDEAPYDAIIVTAGGRTVPDALKAQLAAGGRLVIPVGDGGGQRLLLFERQPDGSLTERDLGGVRFVPLVGAG